MGDKMGQHTATQTIVKPTFTSMTFGLLQRCTATTECDECRKKREGALQRAAISSSPVHDVPPIVHEVLRSPGQPLDAQTRTFMEPRFGHDFSHVRVHTDTRASESAVAVNARAYTVGNDLVFGDRQYSPATSAGRRLLAHELAHTVQQQDVRAAPARIGEPNSSLEHQADQAANLVMSGFQFPLLPTGSLPYVAREIETQTMPAPDGGVDKVTRNVTPGKCSLVPESRAATTGDITSKSAFLQIDLCRGKVSGQIRGELDYGEALQQAGQAVGRLLASSTSPQSLSQALSTFTSDLKQLKPGAEIRLRLLASDVFRLDITGLGDASVAGGVSGKGTARAKFFIGPVELSVEGSVSGGTGDQTVFEITGNVIVGGSKQRAPDCHVCQCREPQITFSCVHIPGQGKTPPNQPPVTLQTRYLPYFFEKAKTTPNPDFKAVNDSNLAEAVRLLSNKYSIARIEGTASPEGPLEGSRGSFKNNTRLSEARAQEGKKQLNAQLNAAIGRAVSHPREKMDLDQLLLWIGADYPLVGRGELFGSNEKGEIPDKELPAQLQDTLKESGKGNLEEFYKTLRRAVIVLDPPQAVPNLRLSPEAAKNILGEPIECTEEHRALFAKTPVANPFEGECKAPGRR